MCFKYPIPTRRDWVISLAREVMTRRVKLCKTGRRPGSQSEACNGGSVAGGVCHAVTPFFGFDFLSRVVFCCKCYPNRLCNPV